MGKCSWSNSCKSSHQWDLLPLLKRFPGHFWFMLCSVEGRAHSSTSRVWQPTREVSAQVTRVSPPARPVHPVLPPRVAAPLVTPWQRRSCPCPPLPGCRDGTWWELGPWSSLLGSFRWELEDGKALYSNWNDSCAVMSLEVAPWNSSHCLREK